MRKVGTLVALTLAALATTARAQEAPPAVAPPADEAPAPAAAPEPAAVAPPAGDVAAAAAPEAAAVAPPAGDVAAAAAPEPAPPPVARKKLQIGLSFLPMALGRFTITAGGLTDTHDMAFAYGFGIVAGYEVLPGLSVGIAPQAILNVQTKEESPGAARQIDLMARLAYAYPVAETIEIFAEVLPGYSLIQPPGGKSPTGWVVAFGAGCAMDVTHRIFASLGVGYQMGFQKRPAEGSIEPEGKTKFLRVALGGGVKF